MSIGNLKDTGNQGNNLPYQWKVLQGLQAIYDEISQPLTCVEDSIAICDANGDALDINANGSINTVIQNVAGTSVTTTTVGGNVGLDVSVLTMPATFAEDSAHVSGNTGAFVLGVRNDTDSVLTSNNGDYSPISVNDRGALKISSGPGLVKIPGALRPNNTSGDLNTVADTFFSVSVANVGSADGTVLSPGVTIKPGEVLNFSADALNNYFTSFPYDATGTEFIIIYVTD